MWEKLMSAKVVCINIYYVSRNMCLSLHSKLSTSTFSPFYDNKKYFKPFCKSEADCSIDDRCYSSLLFDLVLQTIKWTINFTLPKPGRNGFNKFHNILINSRINLIKKNYVLYKKVSFFFFSFRSYLKSFLAWCQILKKYSSLRNSFALA